MTERFVPEMFQTEGKPADLVVSRDCFKDVEKQLDALIGPAYMWHPTATFDTSVASSFRRNRCRSSRRSAPLNASPVRVVLVDDHLSVVESFALLLQLDSDFTVSGVATSAEEGERLVLETSPDIAVFDVDFPGRDSFDLIPGLMAERPQTRIVILTAHLTDAFLSQALRMKVSGYILKSEPATSVRSALKMIHRGQTYFSSKAQDCLIWDAEKQAYEVKMESLLKGLSLLQLAS